MSKNALATRQERSVGWGYALWLPALVGVHGLHRLYAGRYVSGAIWLFTWGLCGVGTVVDLLFIPRMIEDHNEGRDVW
jgi:TM2 domain-containing membrane protein YozV